MNRIRCKKRFHKSLIVRFIVPKRLYNTGITIKEETDMKTKHRPNLTVVQPRAPRYPNQADRQYYEQKLLDIVTSAISGAGIFTIFLCFILM